MNLLQRIKQHLGQRGLFVIADPIDNSITFSKQLFQHIQHNNTNTQVLTFTLKHNNNTYYAFTINPALPQTTQLATIQRNDHYHTVGYECLVPTVNRIFYDYNIPQRAPTKLTITIQHTHNITYYRIEQPKQ